MALREAILACLSNRSLTGYELAKVFDDWIGFFWHANHQQIYRELRQMSATGLLADEHVPQRGKPGRIVYSLTHAGEERLRDWTAEPPTPPTAKDDLMVKMFALAHADLAALVGQLRERRRGHEARLQAYSDLLATLAGDTAPDAKHAGRRLGLMIGVDYERIWRNWCDDALREVEGLIERSARADGP